MKYLKRIMNMQPPDNPQDESNERWLAAKTAVAARTILIDKIAIRMTRHFNVLISHRCNALTSCIELHDSNDNVYAILRFTGTNELPQASVYLSKSEESNKELQAIFQQELLTIPVEFQPPHCQKQ